MFVGRRDALGTFRFVRSSLFCFSHLLLLLLPPHHRHHNHHQYRQLLLLLQQQKSRCHDVVVRRRHFLRNFITNFFVVVLFLLCSNAVPISSSAVAADAAAVVASVRHNNLSYSVDNLNKLPGVVVLVSPKTALISHEIANRVVAELRQQNEIEFPIRLRKVKCDFAEAVKAVYEMSSLEFHVSFLLTDLCPDVNFRLSQVLKYRNMALITASDNNPAFRDRQLYANTFSIVPSTESLSRATLNFMQMNDWRKMLLVYDAHTPASSYYSLISSALLRFLEQNGIEVGRPIENKVFDSTITHIQNSGFKIVFLLMPAEEIAEFLCDYIKVTDESSLPRLAWLLHTDVTEMPIEIVLEETCPGADKLKLLTAFAIRFAPYDLIDNETSTMTTLPVPGRVMCSDRQRHRPRGISSAAVIGSEMATHAPSLRLNSSSNTIVSHYYRCYYYDGLKAIFRALRTSLAFSSNPFDASSLISNFKQLRIDGKTGPIRFNRATCERLGQVEVVQLANGRPRWIVVFDLSSPTGTARNYRNPRWPRGRPPHDSVIRRIELETVPVELLASFSAAALLGIAASVGILVTNIRFRRHSYIKMSSPNLNNFILIGSCLCYTNVVFQGLGTNMLASTRLFEAICTIGTWSLPIGFSLAFGAMLTKTWRVHTIFRHTTGLKRQVIPDSKLIFVVFSFVLLDILLNTMWVVFDAQIREVTITQTTLADAYETSSYIESCSSSYSLWWTLALWLPKGALLIYGLVLAWKTRGVRLAALNDSYQIGVSIYIIVVLCTIGATTQPLFKTKVVISYCVLSSTLLLSTFVPEIVIFAPKLLKLWKDPIGDQRMLREEMKRATKSTDRVANELARRYISSEVRSRRVRLSELSDDVYKLESQLAQISEVGDKPATCTIPDVSISFAMVAIGATLMAPPRSQVASEQQLQLLPPPTPHPSRVTSYVSSDDKEAEGMSVGLVEISSPDLFLPVIDSTGDEDNKDNNNHTVDELTETLHVDVYDLSSNRVTSMDSNVTTTLLSPNNLEQRSTEIIITNEAESEVICGDEDISIIIKRPKPVADDKPPQSNNFMCHIGGFRTVSSGGRLTIGNNKKRQSSPARRVRLSSSGGDLVSVSCQDDTVPVELVNPHLLHPSGGGNLLMVANGNNNNNNTNNTIKRPHFYRQNNTTTNNHFHHFHNSVNLVSAQLSPIMTSSTTLLTSNGGPSGGRVLRSKSSCVNIYCDTETFL